MRKPQHFEFKQWLCQNTIVGLRVHYVQTGTDTATTEWTLTPDDGKPKRVAASTVEILVEVRPDWVRVLQVKKAVRDEVKAWEEFAAKEAADLTEYERLKAKFSASPQAPTPPEEDEPNIIHLSTCARAPYLRGLVERRSAKECDCIAPAPPEGGPDA